MPPPWHDHALWARLAAVAPVGLALGGPWIAVPVWATVLGTGVLSGSLEVRSREARPSASCARPWSTAAPLAWSGAVILRTTGWASLRDDDSWRAPARLMHPDTSPLSRGLGPIASGDGVLLRGQGRPPAPGAVITGRIELKPPPAAGLEGSFDYRRFLAGRSQRWTGRLLHWRQIVPGDPIATAARDWFLPMRQAVTQKLEDLLPMREAAVAKGVLLGHRDTAGRRASLPFADLGLAHLFAVSGLHVGILLGIFVLPGRMGGLGPWPRVIPLVILLGIYVLLTGMPGSVVRAAGLGTGAMLAAPLGRKNRPLALVGLLFWAGIVWEPDQILDTGVRLSYFAAGGILAVSGLTRQFRWTDRRVGGFVAAGLAVSVTAQWFTLPFIADSFGRISLASPVANLVAVPLFGLAIWATVLALLSSGFCPWAAEAFAGWAWLLMRALSAAVTLATGPAAGWPLGLPVPGTSAVAAWSVLTVLMLTALGLHGRGRLGGRRTLGAIAGMIATGLVVFGPASWQLNRPERVTVWQFDAGQGDCGLLVFPDGWSALIDTGGRFGTGRDGPLSRTILPYLRRHNIRRIDAAILTHGHRDHTGGAALLAADDVVATWHYSGRADAAVRAFADSRRGDPTRSPGHVLHRWRDWVPPWWSIRRIPAPRRTPRERPLPGGGTPAPRRPGPDGLERGSRTGGGDAVGEFRPRTPPGRGLEGRPPRQQHVGIGAACRTPRT